MAAQRTSVHGRRLYLDENDNLSVGAGGVGSAVMPVSTASSTSTTIAGYGVSPVTSTSTGTYTVTMPAIGVEKIVQSQVTSTGQVFVLASGAFVSTDGSTQNKATLGAYGSVLGFMGYTSALAIVTRRIGSVVLSTS